MTQPEARLQRRIQNALRAQGYFVFKVHGDEYMMSGLPDLIVCAHGLYIGLEVKMPGNNASEIQKWRHEQIREAGGAAFVVYSVEESLERIEEVLVKAGIVT